MPVRIRSFLTARRTARKKIHERITAIYCKAFLLVSITKELPFRQFLKIVCRQMQLFSLYSWSCPHSLNIQHVLLLNYIGNAAAKLNWFRHVIHKFCTQTISLLFFKKSSVNLPTPNFCFSSLSESLLQQLCQFWNLQELKLKWTNLEKSQ